MYVFCRSSDFFESNGNEYGRKKRTTREMIEEAAHTHIIDSFMMILT
jgi:hypothetical protein